MDSLPWFTALTLYSLDISAQMSPFTVRHSLYKAPWSGTLCRMTSVHSRTMSPLDSIWKPGFSPATSVPSALETSWQLRYGNSHLPLSLPLQEVWRKLKRAVKQHMVETETKRCDYTRGPCSPCLVQSVPEWTASVMQVLSFPHNSLPKTHYRHSSSTASHLSQHTINIGTLHTATLIDWARFNVPPNTL